MWACFSSASAADNTNFFLNVDFVKFFYPSKKKVLLLIQKFQLCHCQSCQHVGKAVEMSSLTLCTTHPLQSFKGHYLISYKCSRHPAQELSRRTWCSGCIWWGKVWLVRLFLLWVYSKILLVEASGRPSLESVCRVVLIDFDDVMLIFTQC